MAIMGFVLAQGTGTKHHPLSSFLTDLVRVAQDRAAGRLSVTRGPRFVADRRTVQLWPQMRGGTRLDNRANQSCGLHPHDLINALRPRLLTPDLRDQVSTLKSGHKHTYHGETFTSLKGS